MLLTAMFLFAPFLAAPSPSEAHPFAALPEYERLAGRPKEIFDAVAAQEFCGCDSALTLQACLKDRPKCALAGKLGEVLLQASASGASQTHVATFMSQSVLGPLCAPPIRLSLGDAPRRGSQRAELVVAEFFDYRCTHCRQAMPLVEAGLKSAGNRAALSLLPVALVPNSPSTIAGEAALAADQQGKFWPMHAALFAANETAFTKAGVRAIAKEVGLDLTKFDAALASNRPAKRLAAFRENFVALGLDGTPAMYVNGRRFDLEPGIFDLSTRLELEAKRGDKGCL